MLRFETWPAGESGRGVCAPTLVEPVRKPLKNALQYGWFPPGSFDDEHRLLLLETCASTVPIGTNPPVPPPVPPPPVPPVPPPVPPPPVPPLPPPPVPPLPP